VFKGLVCFIQANRAANFVVYHKTVFVYYERLGDVEN